MDAQPRAALEVRDDGDDRDHADDVGDPGDDKGQGGDKRGEVGGDKGGAKEGDRGVRRGSPVARMRSGYPPPRMRGRVRVATRERGTVG